MNDLNSVSYLKRSNDQMVLNLKSTLQISLTFNFIENYILDRNKPKVGLENNDPTSGSIKNINQNLLWF